jgi:hypothetical protein
MRGVEVLPRQGQKVPEVVQTIGVSEVSYAARAKSKVASTLPKATA